MAIVLITNNIREFEEHKLVKEFRVDYHKSDEHVDFWFELQLLNIPCSIISVEYRDLMGQDIHEIPINKSYVDNNKNRVYNEQYKKMNTLDEIREEARKYPGCRIQASFDKMLKVRSEVHINMKEYAAIY